jgi:hypothetical protein
MRISLFPAMRFSSLIFALAAFALLSGCAQYQLGTNGKLAFRTLYVEPVENKTQLPQATAIIGTQIRDALLRDGRVTLVASPDEADATLRVTLTSFGREVATASPNDTGLARKFDLHLSAHCTLRDNKAGKALFENRLISTQQQIFATATPEAFESQQLQAEYQAVPLLARSLADKVAHAALDVW